MLWEVYDVLGWVAQLASLLVTAVCLVRGWRRERAARAARICFGTAVVVLALGLVGTAHGLWTAFGAVGDSDAAERATLLARGISEAMNCTAFGIVAMLPPMIASAVLLFLRAPSKRAH